MKLPARFVVACACLALTVIPLAGRADVLDDIKARDTIRIGFDEGAPFSFKSSNGAFTGYTIDICLKIADEIRTELKKPKLKVDFVEVTTDKRFDKILDGSMDMECGSTTNNAERRERVAFAIPTFIAGGRMLVPKNSAIDRLEHLSNKRVAVTPNTSYDDITRHLTTAKGMKMTILKGKDDEASLQMLLDGKVDAVLNDDVLLATLLARSGRSAEFRLNSSPLTVEPLAVMFKKNNPRLKKVADKVIAGLMLSGEITTLHRKWFQSTIPGLNINLNLPISTIMRAYMSAPSDFVPDLPTY